MTLAPSGLYARLCHTFPVIIIITFLDPGTSFPGCETLSKVCGVWNGYNGSEIVKVLDRQTALKRWIAAEIRWYRNVISRGSAVLRDALLPISEINIIIIILLIVLLSRLILGML